MRQDLWTPEQDAHLFEKKSDVEISRITGRTRKAIKSRRFYLRHLRGAKAKQPTMIRTEWQIEPDGSLSRTIKGV